MKRNGNGKSGKRLVIVDDDPTVRESLSLGLGEAFEIVAICASGDEAMATLTRLPVRDLPHAVLLDIRMPGMDGTECCRELRKAFPQLVIAMHTARAVREKFEEARVAGADAYLVKGSLPPAQLANTLLRLKRAEGQCLCVAGDGLAHPATTRQVKPLTPCETRVVELLSEGLMQKEVAAGLGCSLRNVRKHLAAAKRRQGAGTIAQLIRIWTEK